MLVEAEGVECGDELTGHKGKSPLVFCSWCLNSKLSLCQGDRDIFVTSRRGFIAISYRCTVGKKKINKIAVLWTYFETLS